MKASYLSEDEKSVFTAYKRLENGKEAIFIHIPKTAGTSVRQTLEFPRPVHSDFHFNKHYRLDEIEHFLAPDCINNAFIFAFVRNPWDRLYSAYKFRRRKVFSGEAKKTGPEERAKLAEFGTWVRHLSKRNKPTTGVITTPQLDWIKNSRGEVQVDFLARYENITEDYAKICQLLGVEWKPLKRVNISERERDYRHYYTDFERSFVEEHYQEDIEYLGYEF